MILTALMFCLSSTAVAQTAAERGRYLVEEVAKCGDCHTPAGPKGEPDNTRRLKGATLSFASLHPVPGWKKVTPDLTPEGRLWKKWSAAGLVKFLTTGVDPSGHAPDPPMPSYKLTRADAEAVVAYLKTLK